MIRKRLFGNSSNGQFLHRGTEIFRVEALSDGVFAFSVSLLVASLEAPKTFNELKSISAGAIPFFATVVMLFSFWYKQYVFFRRYGLNDLTTILLNLAYLAVILFYIYPLKFLFSILISYWSGIKFSSGGENSLSFLSGDEFSQLIILFSIGYLLIWTLVYLMHRHALRHTDALNLSYYELQFTRLETRGALWNALIGSAALICGILRLELIASLCYLLIPVIMIANDYRFKRSLEGVKMAPRKQIAIRRANSSKH